MSTEPAVLNTDDLRHWRACTRRFWLHRRQTAPGATDDATPAPALAEALRASFPGARAIAPPRVPAEWDRAVADTTQALQAPRWQAEGAALFGACLRSDDGAQVRVDVLVRAAHGLRLFKLRWATVGDESDVDAVALWAHVAARAGHRVAEMGLLLVDSDFLYPGHGLYAGLLREVDLAPALGSRPVPQWLVDMRRCERGPQPPVSLTAPCTRDGGCEFLGRCLATADHHPEATEALHADPRAALEVVGRELADTLRGEGHATLHDVPLARLADPRHRRAARAVQQGAPVLEPAVAALMRAQPGPRHFLRMNTIGFAVPIWPGTRPYQVMPFQWRCAIEDPPGVVREESFLAGAEQGSGDPRRAFATTLLQALGHHGVVFAYNAGFERNRLRELAVLFDDLAAALEALLPRIVDLFQVARAHYYHPAMAGSWSFKSVFRALAPDLRVDTFEGAGAPSVPAAFTRSLQRGVPAETARVLRQALQDHALRETTALRRMVALFESAEAPG